VVNIDNLPCGRRFTKIEVSKSLRKSIIRPKENLSLSIPLLKAHVANVVIFIVLMVDPIAALFIEPACITIGRCSSHCNQKCISKGYPKGGVCMGFKISDLACCCNNHNEEHH